MEAERVSGIAVPNIRSKHARSQSFEVTRRTNTLHSQVLHQWTTNFPKENGFNQFPNTIMIMVLQPVLNFDRPRDAICISWGLLARIVLLGKGVSLYTQPQTGVSGLRIYIPRRQSGPALPPDTTCPF